MTEPLKTKIIPTDTKQVEKYIEYVKIIVRCMGHKACYISDESLISDFISYKAKKEEVKETLKKLKKRIRVEVKPKDLVYKVAKRMYKKEQQNESR